MSNHISKVSYNHTISLCAEGIAPARSPKTIYQMIADRQCLRHQAEHGEDWPTHTSPVVSRYPNILAELDGSGQWLDHIAKCAEVSQPIMASAMVRNGNLSFQELIRLARNFKCTLEYLSSPALSIVDPSTNKGRIRLRQLEDLVKQTEGLDCFLYNYRSKAVLPTLKSGHPVTYAAYRWACNSLQDVLNQNALNEAKQQRIRSSALAEEPKSKPAPQGDSVVRIQLARAHAELRKRTARLDEMRRFAASINAGEDFITSVDLNALQYLSGRDLFGAFVLAIDYGRAIGYRAAIGEL